MNLALLLWKFIIKERQTHLNMWVRQKDGRRAIHRNRRIQTHLWTGLGAGQGNSTQCIIGSRMNNSKSWTETNGKLPPSILLGTEQTCSEQVLWSGQEGNTHLVNSPTPVDSQPTLAKRHSACPLLPGHKGSSSEQKCGYVINMKVCVLSGLHTTSL